MHTITEKIVFLQELADDLPEWVFVLEPGGTVAWQNRACTAAAGTGRPPAPQRIEQLFPDSAGDFMADMREIAATGEGSHGIQRPVRTGNGDDVAVRIDEVPLRDTAGRVTGLAVFCTDITDQQEIEQFKKDAYEQIEKNIEQFAILGDHIRNPLTAIIGLCDLLDDRAIAGKINDRAREIDDIITKIDRGWIESEKVRTIIKKYYDIGATGTHELVARAIHAEYLAQQAGAGITPDTNPSMRPWNELPHRLKDSNLKQADDIWRKLHLISCAIGLLIDPREPPFAFSEGEIEFLAEKEHERWVDERVRKGWVYGRERNDQLMVHDCIVPWDALPEVQREKDRNAVRQLPAVLARVHLKIVRTGDRKY
jgi:PAS domain S-box-containing protein